MTRPVAPPTLPTLSVIVPAHRCRPALARCLDALRASDLPRARWELLVVDDGSGDDTPSVAASVADRVILVDGGPRGPAYARNCGARVADGDVLVFIDADVCVERSALRRFAHVFGACPDTAAVFGAYDDRPAAPGLVSQYRNLVHHYVHTAGAGDATTFWAGCGAVRRDVFLAVGGFDHVRYPRPQIEDVDLGYRLSGRGYRILLDPKIRGTHLKRWTVRDGIVTDFRDRGVPWMQLLLERGDLTAAGPLNLAAVEKACTALVGASVLACVAAALHDPWWLALAAAGITAALGGNFPLLRWLAQVRGWRFALCAIPLRILSYALNVCAAVWGGWAYARHGRRPLPFR